MLGDPPQPDKPVKEKLKTSDLFALLLKGKRLSTDGGKTWIEMKDDEFFDQAGKPTTLNPKKGDWEVVIETEPKMTTGVGYMNLTKEGQGDIWPTIDEAVRAVGKRTDDYLFVAVPFTITVNIDPASRQPYSDPLL